MTELNNAVILVTGATGGFGREMTRQFLDEGSRLLLTDIDAAALESLTGELQTDDGRILRSVAADLADEAGCHMLFDAIQATGIKPDILLNNAGIGVGGRFDHVPLDRWEQVVQLNLLAPMRLSYLFLPQMIERGGGHIVNISSLAGWVGASGMASYCATKFGLRGFGDSLASDYEEFGIRLSTIYPSFSRTPILSSEQFGYEERHEVPEEMLSEPADVAAEIVKGVKNNTRDIFPDKTSRRVHYLKRFMPWIIPVISRRMRQQMLAKKAP
jgi:short-subunit dehydrogenase